MDDIFISVIVNSYRRKEYIEEAIMSLLNQDFDRRNYEIIVVKGFEDKEIDEFLDKKGIINVFVEGSYNGERWAEGIRTSKGQLICFMDDDDTFSPIKLSRIYDLYNATQFEFYHNAYTSKPEGISMQAGDYLFFKNDHKPRTLHKFLKYNIKSKLSINSSSICIKKDIVEDHLEESRRVTVGWDVYLFYLYLSHAQNFISDNTILTYYRKHGSYSHNSGDRSEFRRRELVRNSDADGAYKLYYDIVEHKFLKKIAKYEAFSYKIPLNICDYDSSQSLKITMLLLFLVNAKSYSIKFRFLYFCLGILSRISRSYAFNIYYYLSQRVML